MGNKVKHKTRKAVAKRFKKTKNGKILHRKASRGHLLSSKTRKRKRQLRAGGQLTGGDYDRIIHHLPR
ncbi:MAG: 50S ribosomal protein L35 [Verrucomicrobia bacterium]|nr:MAG: 50S ribosomal protein L35 [Verrucomicrobiota bacterium]